MLYLLCTKPQLFLPQRSDDECVSVAYEMYISYAWETSHDKRCSWKVTPYGTDATRPVTLAWLNLVASDGLAELADHSTAHLIG